jgi:hypothetical protein
MNPDQTTKSVRVDHVTLAMNESVEMTLDGNRYTWTVVGLDVFGVGNYVEVTLMPKYGDRTKLVTMQVER